MSGNFDLDNFEDFVILMIELSSVSNMKKCVSDFENKHLDEQKFGPTGEVHKVENKPGCLIAEMHPSKSESEKIVINFDQEIYRDLKYHQKNTFSNFIKSMEENSHQIMLKHHINKLEASLARISKQDYYSYFPNYSRVLNDLLQLLKVAHNETKPSTPTDHNISQVQKNDPKKLKKMGAEESLHGVVKENRLNHENRMKKHWSKIVEVVNELIKNQPLSSFYTKSDNATSNFTESVYRRYKKIPKDTIKKWLTKYYKNGKLEADLKKLTKD